MRGNRFCGQKRFPRTPSEKPLWILQNDIKSSCVPVEQKRKPLLSPSRTGTQPGNIIPAPSSTAFRRGAGRCFWPQKHLPAISQLHYGFLGEGAGGDFRSKPGGFVTRHQPLTQMQRAYASAAQSMRCYSKNTPPAKNPITLRPSVLPPPGGPFRKRTGRRGGSDKIPRYGG